MADQDNSLESGYEGSAYDSSLEAPIAPQTQRAIAEPKPRRNFSSLKHRKTLFILNGAVLLLVAVIGTASFFLANSAKPAAPTKAQKATNYAVSSLPVNNVKASAQLQLGQADHLTINGQVIVGNTLVLAPTATPTAPTAGQIYYDSATNQPYYYNGTRFVSLAPTTSVVLPQLVNSIGGSSGSIRLGSGLQLAGGQLTLQLQAGNGIAVNGSTVTNNGVVSLAPGSSNITISNDGSGHYSISDSLVGLVSGTGTPGKIALFTTGQSLGDSILGQSGGNLLTVAGSLSVQGAASADSLSVTNAISGGSVGSTGDITLGGNFLQSGTGTFGTGTGAVSLNGNTTIGGTHTLTVGTGATVLGGTLNVTGIVTANTFQSNAGTDLHLNAGGDGSKGIFFYANGTSYALPAPVSSFGPQTICTTDTGCASGLGSAVILGPLSAQTDNNSTGSSIWINSTTSANLLQLETNTANQFVVGNNGNTTIAGTLAVQAGGVTLGGASTQGTLTLYNGANSNTGKLITDPSLALSTTYTLPNDPGRNADIVCLFSLGNCASAGGGVTTPGGTNNYIAKFTGSQTLGNATIYDNGGGVSIGGISPVGLLNVGTTNQFQVSSAGAVTAVGLNSGIGLIQGTGGLTAGGTITLSGLGTGVVQANSGVLSVGNVALGSQTSGNYVASLGTLTGLTNSGTTGPGAIPVLSVSYGALVNTAAQGNTSLSFTGTGNLTGALSGTAGGGFTTTTLDVVPNPTFSGNVTVQGSGGLTLGSATGNTGLLKFLDGTNDGFNASLGLTGPLTGTQNFTLPTTGGVLCTTTTCASGSSAGYVQLQGSTPGLAQSGHLNITGTGIVGNLTVNSLGAGVVHASSAGVLSSSAIVNADLQAGNFTNITGVGNLSIGSIISGFGTISTTNNITTTAIVQGGTVVATGALQGNSLSINGGTFALNSAGAITAATGITSTGTIQGGTINATSVIQLNGQDINTAGILTHVAYLNQGNTFTTGTNTFTASGVTSLAVTGTPPVSAGSSLVQLGAVALSGAAGAGTYLGINQSGTADFLMFQTSGASKFEVSSAGTASLAGSLNFNLGKATSVNIVGLQPTKTSGANTVATVNIPALDITSSTSFNFCIVEIVNCKQIVNGTSLQANANFNIQSASTGSPTVRVQALAGQSHLVSVFDSAGTTQLYDISSTGSVTQAGNLTVQGSGGISVGVLGPVGGVGTPGVNGSITFNSSAINQAVILQAPTSAQFTSGYTLTLPTTWSPSANGFCLKTDSSAQLYFDSCVGGSPGSTGSAAIQNKDQNGSTNTTQRNASFAIQSHDYTSGNIIEQGPPPLGGGSAVDLLQFQNNSGVETAAFSPSGQYLRLDSAGIYSAGIITQSGTVITGQGAIFNSNMSGSIITYGDGSIATITFTDSTHLASSVSKSITSYAVGTISQTGFTITGDTGTGTNFANSMIGNTILYSDGSTATITNVLSATQMTSSVSKTVPTGSTYTLAPRYFISVPYTAALAIGSSSAITASEGINLGGDTQLYRSVNNLGQTTLNLQNTSNITGSQTQGTPIILQAAPNSGSNVSGATLTLAAGQSTGTGNGGDINLQVSPPPSTLFTASLFSTSGLASDVAVDSNYIWYTSGSNIGVATYPSGGTPSSKYVSNFPGSPANLADCANGVNGGGIAGTSGFLFADEGGQNAIGLVKFTPGSVNTGGNTSGNSGVSTLINLSGAVNGLACYTPPSSPFTFVYYTLVGASNFVGTFTVNFDGTLVGGSSNASYINDSADGGHLVGAAIDPSGGFLYWSAGQNSSIVIKRACLTVAACNTVTGNPTPPAIDPSFTINTTSVINGNNGDLAVTSTSVYWSKPTKFAICTSLLSPVSNSMTCSTTIGPGAAFQTAYNPNGLAADGTNLFLANGPNNVNGNGRSIGRYNFGGPTPNILTTVFSLSGKNGSAHLKNVDDSASGFEIQNASNFDVFNVNTASSISTVTGQLQVIGGISTSLLTSPNTNTGLGSAVTVVPFCQGSNCTASTTYGYSVSAVNGNGGVAVPAGIVTTTNTPTLAATINGAQPQAYNKIAWPSVAGAASYNIYRASVSGGTENVGLIGNVPASTLAFTDDGSVNSGLATVPTTDTSGSLNINGTATIQTNGTNSTTAFQVQNAAGSTVFNVDTANSRVGFGTNSPGNLLSIGALTTPGTATTAQIAVSTRADANSGIVVQAFSATQAGDLLQAQASNGAVLAKIDASGNLTVKAATINGTLTLNGHIITGNSSGSTTAAVNTNAGTGGTPACTVSGNDTSGQVTLTTGSSSWAAGVQCTITFATTFSSAPHPVISNAASVSTAAVGVYVGSTTTTLTVNFMNADTAQHTYSWNYFNSQ